MKFYLVLLSVLFVFQVGALNKEDIFNPSLPEVDFNWAEDTVMDGVDAHSQEVAKPGSNTGSAVSHVVLFENMQPVCVADVVGRPELVPRFMEVARQATEVLDMGLPPCNDVQLSVLRHKASEALLINGDEPVQMADLSITFIAAFALCAAGAASALGVRVLKSELNHTEQGNTSLNVSSLAGAGLFVATVPPVAGVALVPPVLPLIATLPIMGVCGLGTYNIAAYLKGNLFRFR